MVYLNSTLELKVDHFFINRHGRIVELVKKKVKPSGWIERFLYYFVDKNGQRYWPNGQALKGKTGGLPPREMRDLVDKAQQVKIGWEYDVHWEDGRSVGHYTVISLHENGRGYMIRWSNGQEMEIRYGCPINYDAVRVK